MRVLVACEFSGTVRDAFRARGFDALSCDLLPTEAPGPHYTGSVLDILYDGWDLLIAHPPCTYLASSGLHWNKRRPERAALTEEAVQFVRLLHDAPIPHIAIENPIGCLSTRLSKPDQIIQPWYYGDDASKATCLWLKNLPKLVPTNIVSGREARVHKLPPSADRWKLRSVTYAGIAAALADQWGAIAPERAA